MIFVDFNSLISAFIFTIVFLLLSLHVLCHHFFLIWGVRPLVHLFSCFSTIHQNEWDLAKCQNASIAREKKGGKGLTH